MSHDTDSSDGSPSPEAAEQDSVSDAEEQFPWQRRESVNFDLHGAPTWDPSQYEPLDEPDSSPTRGGLFRRTRPRPRPSPSPGPAHAKRPGVQSTDAAELAARLERERLAEAERIEAERSAASRGEEQRREAARADAERRRAAQRVVTERLEAERREAERIEAERVEAERVEAERVEAERVKAERVKAERVKAERVKAERVKAERVEAERREAERVEAQRAETERAEAERAEAERAEAARVALAELAQDRSARQREAHRRVELRTDEQVPIELLDGDAVETRPSADPTPPSPEAPQTEEALDQVAGDDPPVARQHPERPEQRDVPTRPHDPSTRVAQPREPSSQDRPSPFVNPMPAPQASGAAERPAASAGTERLGPLAEAAATDHDGADHDGADHDGADHDGADHDGADHDGADHDESPASTSRQGGFLRRHRQGLVRTLVTVIVVAAVAVLLRIFVVQPYYIPSASMEPTLHGCNGCTDDRIIVNKLSYKIHDVHPGDIVVFDRPAGLVGVNDKVLVKRVVALGGDTLVLQNDQIFVNGLPIVESYLDTKFLAKNCPGKIARPENGTTRWQIPIGDVFVMGDNRCNSEDSRTFGPIPKKSIIGEAAFIFWPLDRISGL